MNKNDILRIIKNEGLRIPKLNKNPNDTEEKALFELLDWLRDQHYIDSI